MSLCRGSGKASLRRRPQAETQEEKDPTHRAQERGTQNMSRALRRKHMHFTSSSSLAAVANCPAANHEL